MTLLLGSVTCGAMVGGTESAWIWWYFLLNAITGHWRVDGAALQLLVRGAQRGCCALHEG
jgi:hypothetical protein